MISDISIRIITCAVQTGIFFRIFPWTWDNKTLTMKMSNRETNFLGIIRIENFGFKLVVVLYYFNFGFAICRILQSVFILEKSFQNVMFQLFVLSVCFLGIVLLSNTFFRPQEIANLYSIIFLNDKQLTESYQIRKVFDRAMPLIAFFTFLAACEVPALVIVYLANTDKPVYLGSLKFYIPWEYSTIRSFAEFFFFLYEIEMVLVVVCQGLLYGMAFIAFLKSMSFWMDELNPNLEEASTAELPITSFSTLIQKTVVKALKNSRPTRPECRSFENVSVLYRRFQLVTILINTDASIALTGQHFAAATLFVTSAFSTMHFWGWHNFETIRTAIGYLIFAAALIIFGTWIILIQTMPAQLKDKCPKFRWVWEQKVSCNGGVISKWPTKKSKKVLEYQRFIWSCTDMVFRVGSFFPYEVSTMPAVMEVCLDNLVTLLLAAKK